MSTYQNQPILTRQEWVKEVTTDLYQITKTLYDTLHTMAKQNVTSGLAVDSLSY